MSERNPPLRIQIPSTPNFLRVGESVVPLHVFSDEQLEILGREWTRKLVEKARKRREKKEER